MRRAVAMVALTAAALCTTYTEAHGQAWPDWGAQNESNLEWIVGASTPVSGLGSFGSYRIVLDAWPMAGVSFGNGSAEDLLRTRFQITAVPSVAMRRTPLDRAGAACEDCSSDSFRLTLINAGFLFDVGFDLPGDSRGYFTGGPAMRFQLSDPEECPSSAGQACALPQFGRARIDPGLTLGAGWQPPFPWLKAIELSGRMSLYGRGERPEAHPRSWLPEAGLTVRFSPGG